MTCSIFQGVLESFLKTAPTVAGLRLRSILLEQELWMSIEDYDEYGASLMHEKVVATSGRERF